MSAGKMLILSFLPWASFMEMGKPLEAYILSRTDTHRIETKAKLIFQNAETNFQDEGLRITDVVFRDIIESDYGID